MGLRIINALGIKDRNKTRNASLTSLAQKYVLQEVGNDALNGNKDLILIALPQGARKILRVSFNGSEESVGTLQIYNASNQLLKKNRLKLIKYPFYTSLDISDLQDGVYRAELSTSKGVHTASIALQ